MEKGPILAGDIGGTSSRLALYDSRQHLYEKATYTNADFEDFLSVLNDFLSTEPLSPTRACLGVAGPVHNNCATLTNIDWLLNGKQIRDCTGIPEVLLVNDLVATAAGLSQLDPRQRVTLNIGNPQANGTVAVIAPGTGLGQAYVIPNFGTPLHLPSEGGHCSFAPRNSQQVELLAFMLQYTNHVSVEKVCSGKGIPQLFAFISQSTPPARKLAEKINITPDPTPIIIQSACNSGSKQDVSCETASKTLQLFIDILAAESANLALKVLATGGVYIGGGLPPRMVDLFDPTRFMQIFCRGTFKNLLAEIPVHLILEPRTALFGASSIALKGEKSNFSRHPKGITGKDLYCKS